MTGKFEDARRKQWVHEEATNC